MMCPPDTPKSNEETLRDRLIGLGERSHRKSYYPELQRRLEDLERFKAFLDHSNDSIFLLEAPDAHIIDVNEATCRRLGYRRDALLGRSIFDFSGLGEVARVRELLGSATRDPWNQALVETTLHRREGGGFPVEITLNRLIFHERACVIAVARDITERKAAEAALRATLIEVRESKDKIDTILKSVADGLIVTDPKNNVVLMNRAAQDLLHIPPGEAFGQPLDTLFTERMIQSQASCPWPLDAKGGPAAWEIPGAKGQMPRIVQAYAALVQDPEGKVSGEVTTLRDITREREFERMKNAFISRAAHELRTPLTSILGFADVLLHREEYGLTGPDQGKELLGAILKSGNRLSEIIQDLLDLSQIQAGRSIVLDRSLCDLGELLAEKVERYRLLAAHHHLELTLPKQMPCLTLDRRRIDQVLDNLLSNAVKYSLKGSVVRVSAEASAAECRITVEDAGIGMFPTQIERIFDSFYRIDTSDTAVEGLGLGMGIVKTIVEAHGGTIQVESEPGKGTKVHFTLPRAEVDGSS